MTSFGHRKSTPLGRLSILMVIMVAVIPDRLLSSQAVEKPSDTVIDGGSADGGSSFSTTVNAWYYDILEVAQEPAGLLDFHGQAALDGGHRAAYAFGPVLTDGNETGRGRRGIDGGHDRVANRQT